MSKKNYRVAVLPGDGIGPGVMRPCIAILDAATRRCGCPPIAYDWLDAGAGTYLSEGEALPERTLSACREADAILLGAMGLPHVRYPDGTEVAPQLDLRTQLSLYAGVRPI